MATKEPQAVRPQNPHRLSMNSAISLSTPSRGSNVRHHSHSVSLGSINSNHRVTRRKSTNASNIPNVSAVKAALKNMSNGGVTSVFDSNVQSHRASIPDFSRPETHDGNIGHNVPSDYVDSRDTAIAEGYDPSVHTTSENVKPRARRASEGSYLTKGDSKRTNGELRCETCGKGYKHSSCLTKHLWEHDPAWAYTSKLLISKHQQVQLLEAASVLVNMNAEATAPEPANVGEGDDSSVSPVASGSSEIADDYESIYSSAETTPPPMSDHYAIPEGISTGRAKRSSGISSAYSRSYQSAPSSSLPTSNGFSQYSSPLGYTSGITGEDESGLAAAVETLCSFGTPRSGPSYLPADVPPVPPLPARYLEHNSITKSGNMLPQPDFGLPSPSYQPLSSEREVRTGTHRQSISERHSEHEPRKDRLDDDEGIFGSMEGVTHGAN